ncbi:hypothetical protein [Clostridium botulinum]|uniref:hypothetical protein n=1 Tax=Clostridium botulinum TaxID=1491 RepID=UPI000580522A|nr:hypothetical protein [Clostridium botulinum]
MAIIQNDKLKFEIKNITSLYAEFSNINNQDDIGTYEAFDCIIKIGDSIILNKNLELCSGNIQELLTGINSILLDDDVLKFQLEFYEPDLEFNIDTISENNYLLTIWCCAFIFGDKSNNDNAISLHFDLTKEELLKFRNDLQQEWDNKKKMVMMSDIMG